MPRYITYFLDFVAALAFFLTLFLLLTDRSASASVSLALGFGCLLFRIIPSLDSFEILGLKAKLKEKIGEADETLAKMRRLSSVVMKAAIMNTAWSNRFDGMPYHKQAEILDEQAKVLSELGLSNQEILEVKRPALMMVSQDLFFCFIGVLERTILVYTNAYGKVRSQFSNASNPLVDSPELEKYRHATERQESYSYGRIQKHHELVLARPEDLRGVMREVLSLFRLSIHDQSALEEVVNKVSTLSRAIWSSQRLQEDVGEFLNKNVGDTLFNEFFPTGPTGPDWDVGRE